MTPDPISLLKSSANEGDRKVKHVCCTVVANTFGIKYLVKYSYIHDYLITISIQVKKTQQYFLDMKIKLSLY